MRDERTELEREIAELTRLLNENSDLSAEWQRAVAQAIAWARARLAVVERARPETRHLDPDPSDSGYSAGDRL